MRFTSAIINGTISRFSQSLSAGLFCSFLLLASPAYGQSADLQQAVAAYQSANFDQAIAAFSQIAENTSADKTVRREALQYLGRTYIAKRQEDEARRVMVDLIELEPPIYELDPVVEPPPLMNIYYDARKAYAGSEAMPVQAAVKTLAIIDFTNSSIGEDLERFAALTQGLPAMMINALNGATDIKVVERERLQWLLEEHNLAQSGMVDPATAVQAGRLLGANHVLIGGYTIFGRNVRLLSRLVDVETSEILRSTQLDGRTNDLFDLIEQLSAQIARELNEEFEPGTGLGASRKETKSLDAALSFSQGLALLEKQDYQGAYAKFEEALTYDPSYEVARLKRDSLMPVLAAR